MNDTTAHPRTDTPLFLWLLLTGLVGVAGAGMAGAGVLMLAVAVIQRRRSRRRASR